MAAAAAALRRRHSRRKASGMWNWAELILASTLLWLYLETAWILLVNFLFFTVPWLIWGAIVIHLLIRFGVRVPPPAEATVTKVLGVDPQTFVQKDDGIIEIKDESDLDQQYCMRVVAHRGAAFDYPENSIYAIRSVSVCRLYHSKSKG